jgi:hypothetical protein
MNRRADIDSASPAIADLVMVVGDTVHSLLLIGVGFIAGAVTIGYFVLGGMLRESQRLTKAVGALVIQETGKLRSQ